MFKCLLVNILLMAEPKLKALKLDISHHGCFGSYITEKFPDTSMKIVSNIHLLKKSGALVGYQVVVEAMAPNARVLDSLLKCLKQHKDIKEMMVWGKTGSRAFVFLKVKSSSSSYEEVIKKGAMYFDNIRMERGFDVHSIITTDFTNLKSLLNGLEEIGEVKVTKIGAVGPFSKKEFITDKQADAVRKAISFDYYSWPRKASLEFLAGKSNLSRRAYQEHLRRAESKLLPELLKDYLLTRSKE
jgi:predicted DNA binding protein